MSKSRKNTFFISIVGPDQVGLIAEVAGRLFDLGINLADTSFCILGQGFEFSCVAEAMDGISARDIEAELASLTSLKGADVKVSTYRFSSEAEDNAEITHIIEVDGGDQPGLIARLAEVFIDYQANVVRMNSVRRYDENNQGRYITTYAISVDENRAAACLSAINNTAGQLKLNCRYQKL